MPHVQDERDSLLGDSQKGFLSRRVQIVLVLGIIALSIAIIVFASVEAANHGRRQGPSNFNCQSFPQPKSYVAYKLTSDDKLVIDGKLDEKAWLEAAWTDPFVDIQGPWMPKPRFETKAKMRWDDTHLYIGAYIEEPNIWATVTEHNKVIFVDNDFEVFLDPSGTHQFYKEFEMNAFNTTWDLYLTKPYMNGGQWYNNWEIYAPIRTGTYINGTINDPRAGSKYWTVEIAMPLANIAWMQNTTRVPPVNNDRWRINFSRVEYHVYVVNNTYHKNDSVPEDNWVWSPQNVINMHVPEKWGFLQFSTAPVNTASFVPDKNWALRSVLMQVYDAQRTFQTLSGYYATKLSELKLPGEITSGTCVGVPTLAPQGSSTPYSFLVTIVDNHNSSIIGTIDQDRFLVIHE